MIATIIGASVSITIILIYLKKKFKFKYFDILSNISKTAIPLLAMALVVFLINYILPETASKILLLLEVLSLGIIGAIIYLVLLYKNNGLYQTFGKEQIDSILKKLRIKRN